MRKVFFTVVHLICFCSLLSAQDKFEVNVSKVGDYKVKVEWTNPYGERVVQINVQRSWDSIKYFLTAFAPLSPELPQNGYIDESAGYAGMYYRIFYVLEDGSFFFTKAKKVTTGLDFTNEITEDQIADKNFQVTIHDDDSVIAQLSYEKYKRFRDSIINYTRDTLYSLSDADILIRYFANGINWIPSAYIFTNNDGYVQIYLADAIQKNYRLRVFDENHKSLFNIQHIDETQLVLDKTDFMHAGWFYFELYENDRLKERNKFYIPKDF
jgi:hypothetical protein